MHGIVGRGIIVLLAGVFALQLIVPGQFFRHLTLMQFLLPLLIFDFFLGSSAFGTNLKYIE